LASGLAVGLLYGLVYGLLIELVGRYAVSAEEIDDG